MNVTFIYPALQDCSGCAAELHHDVLPRGLRAEPVVADVGQPLRLLKPAGLDDLAAGAGEDRRGEPHQLRKLHGRLKDRTGPVGGVAGIQHDDQALVSSQASGALEQTKGLELVVVVHFASQRAGV